MERELAGRYKPCIHFEGTICNNRCWIRPGSSYLIPYKGRVNEADRKNTRYSDIGEL